MNMEKAISTVNVIEMSEGSVLGITSWSDTVEGNRAAEDRFRAMCHENVSEPESEDTISEIDDAIEDGHIEEGTWELWLGHSTL